MKIRKQDWMFIGIVVAVLGIFFAITGEEKTHRVPLDDNHKPFYEIVKKSGKMEADKGCPTCHYEPGGVPFPAKHPVKPKDGPSRCLFCHKLKKT
jgi:hypothetical protein